MLRWERKVGRLPARKMTIMKRFDVPVAVRIKLFALEIRRSSGGDSCYFRFHLVAVYRREDEEHHVGYQLDHHRTDEKDHLAVCFRRSCGVVWIEQHEKRINVKRVELTPFYRVSVNFSNDRLLPAVRYFNEENLQSSRITWNIPYIQLNQDWNDCCGKSNEEVLSSCSDSTYKRTREKSHVTNYPSASVSLWHVIIDKKYNLDIHNFPSNREESSSREFLPLHHYRAHYLGNTNDTYYASS